MHIKSERYDVKHPSGTVLWGDKDPGSRVKIGHDIGVTVSRGEEQVPMVDLSEITLERAREIILQNGMRLGQIAEQYHESVPKGYICGQFPEAGQPFRRSEPINLIVSKGQQPTEFAPDSGQLPPPPEPPAVGPDDVKGQSPVSAGTDETPQVTMVSRDVRVRVAIPSDGQRQEVRVVVANAEGEHILYRKMHDPGDLVDQLIHVPREQGATATVRVYVGGVLQFEKQV